MTKLAFSLCFISALAFTQTPIPTASFSVVTGHVYCANGPCRFASVILEPVPRVLKALDAISTEPSGAAASTSCGLDGSFVLQNVRPGQYFVIAEQHGYRSAFGDISPEERDSDSPEVRAKIGKLLQQITVAPNQTATVNIQMERGAAINGNVLYDDGSPAVNVQIHLYRRQQDESWKTAVSDSNDLFRVLSIGSETFSMGAQTDDRGHFRLAGLPPGTYTVEAVLPDMQMSPSGLFGHVSLDMRPTQSSALQVYLGNTMRLGDAEALVVAPGEELNDADLVIPTTSLRIALGIVVAKSDGHGISHGRVSLLDPRDRTLLRETELAEDGTFRFENLTEGPYLLDVRGAVDSSHGVDTQAYESLTQPLLLQGDANGLTLSLLDKPTVQHQAQ